MDKRILEDTEYTFNAISKTIMFFDNYNIQDILLITNVTDNEIIYNFGCVGFGGDLTNNKKLVLDYDTSFMSDTDDLQIVVYAKNSSNNERNKLLNLITKQTEVLDECLEELKINNKYLRKIYNPE